MRTGGLNIFTNVGNNSSAFHIGEKSNGTLNINGGVVSACNVLVGVGTGLTGTVNITGGQLANSPTLGNGYFNLGVGTNSIGILNMSGGSMGKGFGGPNCNFAVSTGAVAVATISGGFLGFDRIYFGYGPGTSTMLTITNNAIFLAGQTFMATAQEFFCKLVEHLN